MKKNHYDAVVIGSGPNGYAAAIHLSRKKFSVLLIEGKETTGGGMRTAELTLPGYFHDVCSTMHPMGATSPFFNSIPLAKHGLEWIYPSVFLAHPFDNAPAAVLMHSIEETAEHLDEDREIYIKLMTSLTDAWKKIAPDILGPISIPKHPFAALKFGLKAVRSSEGFIKRFESFRTRGLFTGLAAHGVVPLNQVLTSAVGLSLAAAAHLKGWPYAKGGSQNIVKALESYFISVGGEILKGHQVNDLNDLPASDTVLFNTSPANMMKVMKDKLSGSYRNRLQNFKYGPGSFKIDFALSEPVPFKDELCRISGFVHIGGTHKEIVQAEETTFNNKVTDKPFVLFAQPTLFDPSRAPEGKHIAYAYSHVPNGSDADMTEAIISQIERFAPGFRDVILSSNVTTPSGMENYNPNYVGGDINAGMQSWDQFFTRPIKSLNPYKTSAKGIFICSASTPPGGGVHGMCGYNAALRAEKFLLKR